MSVPEVTADGRPGNGRTEQGAPPKVSVVVPTYAPPTDRLDALVRSLEAQTMPTSEFEVIFVDDGSPDQTWPHLERIRDSHDNVSIMRIENSGWPSRPRNLGLERARGRYVLFMDHDDELYPRALEAGYAMAARTGADVLNGKETRTFEPKWAVDVYAANLDNARERTDLHPLIPTNPHKLFRRELLMEHGIRFPEGGRVPWEDVFFALDLAPHAEVISVLADTGFYHWVRGRETSSSTFRSDPREYWTWVRKIVLRTNERLVGPRLAGQWRLMMLHQYRSRVLAPLGTHIFTYDPPVLDFVKQTVEELLTSHIPVELDSALTPTQLGRAALLRAGRWDLLPRLTAVDAGLTGLGTTTSVRWRKGRLHLTADSRWHTPGGRPLAIRRDGDRIIRDLPDDVLAALPDGAVDMTRAIAAATASIGIRGRDSSLNWMLPGSCEPRVEDVDGRPELVVRAAAVLDPRTAVLGRPLDETSWELTCRNELLGGINQRGLRTGSGARTAIRRGHVYIAYRGRTGILDLDVDQRLRSLPGSAKLDPKQARAVRRRTRLLSAPGLRAAVGRLLGRRPEVWDVEIPFTQVTTDAKTVLKGAVEVGSGPPRPARLVSRPDGAWLTFALRERPGRYPLTVELQGKRAACGVTAVVQRTSVGFVRERARAQEPPARP